jgi:tetratricopeptide (TPR) repeat protein
MKQLVLVAALIALPLSASAGPKEKAEAQTHIQKATEAHEAGSYDVALVELEAAYGLDPQPDLLYAIGQVQTKLNNCPVAITYYEKFLATKPAAEPTAAANEAINTCKTQMATAPQPEPTPDQQPVAPPEPPPPPPPEPRKFDVIGTTLVGLGVLSTVVGVVMYSSAVNDLDDAENAPTYQEHESLVDDAHSKRTYAVIFTAAGVAAIGIGAWHYLTFRKKEQSRVSVTPTTTGGMVTWQGSF